MSPQFVVPKRREARSQKLVILQATPFCNIDCRYCYLPNRHTTGVMSYAVAEQIFTKVFHSEVFEDPITFVWHAGEPLTASKIYFADMFALAAKANKIPGRAYRHNVQTNGILIDDQWAAMFRANRVSIGVSLDGPAFIHDRQRVTRSGRGTHSKVMRGISVLQKHEVDFKIITVLTDFSLDYPEEMFRFFLENKIESVGFNIDEKEGVNERSSFSHWEAISRYKRFLRKFIRLCDESNGAVTLREVAQLVPMVLSPGKQMLEPLCSTNKPLFVLTFDAQGNFSTFCPELAGTSSDRYENFVMGNIMNCAIESIFDNTVFQTVDREIQAGVQECKAVCQYWAVCGGGFPSNKFFEHGRFDVTETVACRVHKQATVDVVLGYLEERLCRSTL